VVQKWIAGFHFFNERFVAKREFCRSFSLNLHFLVAAFARTRKSFTLASAATRTVWGNKELGVIAGGHGQHPFVQMSIRRQEA